MNWIYVTRHFTDFILNLQLTQNQRDDAFTKARNVAQTLRSNYRPNYTKQDDYLIVGSFGKQTAIRPTSDIDLLYILPYE